MGSSCTWNLILTTSKGPTRNREIAPDNAPAAASNPSRFCLSLLLLLLLLLVSSAAGACMGTGVRNRDKAKYICLDQLLVCLLRRKTHDDLEKFVLLLSSSSPLWRTATMSTYMKLMLLGLLARLHTPAQQEL